MKVTQIFMIMECQIKDLSWYLSVSKLIDSVIKIGHNCYPKVFLVVALKC